MDTTRFPGGDVKLVRWPAEADRRTRYRAMGIMCLLVVEGGAPAPVVTDLCEDWVRAPISKEDLHVRLAGLRARAEAYRIPQVDPYGLLRLARRTVTVSRTETDLLDALIRQFGQLVSREVLQECLPPRPGNASSNGSRNALDLHIMRIRRRIKPLGLVIRTVRGRGHLIEAADPAVFPDTGDDAQLPRSA